MGAFLIGLVLLGPAIACMLFFSYMGWPFVFGAIAAMFIVAFIGANFS